MRDKYGIIWIIVLAFIVRVIATWPVFLDQHKSIHNDSGTHLQVANNIIQGNGFSECSLAPYHKNSYLTPVYPYFLAATNLVLGKDKRSIVFLQILIDLLSTFLVFSLAARIFRRRTGYIASLLYCFSSHALTYIGFVLTETIFTFLLLSLVFMSLRLKSEYLKWVVPFFYMSLVLLRPIAIYLLPILVVFVLKSVDRQIVVNGLVTFLLSVVLITPRMHSIYQLTGRYSVSSIQEYNLKFTFANALLAKKNDVNEEVQRGKLLSKQKNPIFSDCNGNYDYVTECRNSGIQILKEAPVQYIFIHLSKIPNMLLPEITLLSERWNLSTGNKGTLAIINKNGWIAGFKHYYQDNIASFFIMIPLVSLWILALFGFLGSSWRILPKVFSSKFVLIFGIISYFMLIPGPAGNGRFMFPIVPYLMILSANGWELITQKNKK